MVRLVPMTETEFEAFMEISMRDQAQGHIRAGNWRAEDAQEIIEQQRHKLLPQGLATPNHFFFTIEDESLKTKVGGLWFMVQDQGGRRRAFVFDIQVYEEFRRRGYGTQAFRAMEEKAREMGLTTISLHVFGHNHPARAMYEKLGYVGVDAMMSKAIGAQDE